MVYHRILNAVPCAGRWTLLFPILHVTFASTNPKLPLFPPFWWPQVWAAWLWVCSRLVDELICVTCYTPRARATIWYLSFSVWLTSLWWSSLGPFVFLRRTLFHPFSRLSSVLVYIHSTLSSVLVYIRDTSLSSLFWPCHEACRVSVPKPGTNPGHSSGSAES